MCDDTAFWGIATRCGVRRGKGYSMALTQDEIKALKPDALAPAETPEDVLSRDLAALMAYGREEDDHAV